MKRLPRAALAALFGIHALALAAAPDPASVTRGGRLYDHWSRELKDRPPSEPHPLFAGKRGGTTAADSWRCKECHGWDYRGNHGMIGIRGRQDGDPAAIVEVLKNPTHRYDKLMGEGELLDLARFVSHGQTDAKAIVDSARHAKSAASHERFFVTLCAACHGFDGARLREIAALGESARQRPAELLHVIVNGHPGEAMPALGALGQNFASGILAYLQTLPAPNLAASIAHGGRLYDDWQVEAGARRQALPHPAYPAKAYYANDAALTWRCKSCHGWDYRGNEGSYASGRHATGIKGVRQMAGADPARIVGVLRDSRHLYGAVLKERDLQDLANFVSAGQVDMDPLIERGSGRARGDAGRGAAAYRTICANCHGTDGQRVPTTVPLATAAKANAWGSLHKILNGHPDEKMPALREFEASLLVDILAHLQSLPETR